MKYSAAEGDGAVKWTRFPIRVRPHRNPLSDTDDTHPDGPASVPWPEMFPQLPPEIVVRWADIGSAYGGMLCRMGLLDPNVAMLGLEIRHKVVEFAQSRVLESRAVAGELHNVWFAQCNVMRFLPFWFSKGQLTKMFFCYPDPHFKRAHQRRRVMGQNLVAEYAYVMARGGRLYTVSDVAELEQWMCAQLNAASMLFRRLTEEETAVDGLLEMAVHVSEDAVRSQRKGAEKHYAIYERL